VLGLGTVVIAGQRYPVTRLALRHGMLLITASGPTPAVRAVQEPATVYGEDGQGIGQGWRCDIPGRGDTRDPWVTIQLPFQIGTITNVDRPGPPIPEDELG
jgi:hypothetical protein